MADRDYQLTPYERRVAPARQVLEDLANDLISDLIDDDGRNGGFLWWHSRADWHRRTLIADYTIQSATGVANALLVASTAAQEHREKLYADNHAAMKALSDYARRRGEGSALEVPPRGQADRRRDLAIGASFDSCLFTLGRAFDRLAVGGPCHRRHQARRAADEV